VTLRHLAHRRPRGVPRPFPGPAAGRPGPTSAAPPPLPVAAAAGPSQPAAT
jgi:hypothetical protein